MRITAVGIGGAGGRIVDSLYQDNQQRPASYLGGACVVDTDEDELGRLQNVPDEHRHAFGLFVTEGTGTDGDRASGVAAIEDDRLEVRRAIDPLITSDIDALVLVGGLAGGTGGGTIADTAEALAEVYDRPLYAVSVVPAGWNEQAATNTIRSLQMLSSSVDGQILFDNEAWLGSTETAADSAERLNQELTTQLGALFAAGEASSVATIGESVVDASEIINTLSAPGFTTLGYGSQELDTTESATDESVLSRIRSYISADEPTEVDEVSAYNAIEATLRRAVRGKLTIECSRESADRALSVFRGPPKWLSRDAITDGRRWLEDELQSPEIRSGDVPTPNHTSLSVLVVLSGVTDVPRLEELESLAA